MNRNIIIDEYFEWLYGIICGDRFPKDISYRKLMMHLLDTEFIYSIPKDGNRADDGIHLRDRFPYANYRDIERYLNGPCSVLEMMLALAIRCEENIMDDPLLGDRTTQWFWGMVTNLGLGSMTDDKYDKQFVDDILQTFLNREYEYDGRGGLFTVRNCDRDLRTVEIWYQLCWYLDSIA